MAKRMVWCLLAGLLLLSCKGEASKGKELNGGDQSDPNTNGVTEKPPLIQEINPNATAEDRLAELENLPQGGPYAHVICEGKGLEAQKDRPGL